MRRAFLLVKTEEGFLLRADAVMTPPSNVGGSDVIAKSRRLAREGYGHEDLSKILSLSERDARSIVFGKRRAGQMEKRQRMAKAEKEVA